MSEKKRIDWIDVAKGYGIILVVLGHCFNKGSALHNWIFSFHMPLFFILSGYCFRVDKYSSVKNLIMDKGRSLLIPYAKFWILGLVCALLVPIWRGELSVNGVLVDIYSGYPSSFPITSTWFLIALFMCELIFWIIVKISERLGKEWIVPICIILSGIAGYMVSVVKSLVYDPNPTAGSTGDGVTFLPGNRLPLTLDTCLTAIVFFAIGYWLKHYGRVWLEKSYKLLITLMLLGVNVVTALCLNTRVNLHGCTYGNGIYFYLSALAGSLSIMYFSQWLCEHGVSVMRRLVGFF